LLLAEVKNIKSHGVFVERAEIAYNNGMACIYNRQLSDAENYYRQLTQIKGDAASFSVLVREADQLYNTVLAISKEEAAKEKCENLYKEAVQSKSSADVLMLSYAVKQLGELEGALNQEYTIFILGGDRRIPDDNPNLIRYYLLVEARDPSGNIIPRKVEHEERPGKFVTVRKWGERVGLSTVNKEVEPDAYARVKRDRLVDGVIDNNVFGIKERGYLNPRIMMKCDGKQYPY
jgi:hypothetical protein